MPKLLGPNYAPTPTFSAAGDHEATELFERFRDTTTKIAVQKDGMLTDISREVLLGGYGIVVPPRPKRQLVSISPDGSTGFVYARNKAICGMVAAGAVDLAVVGTDRLIEDGVEDSVEIVASYRDRYSWELVVATPINSGVDDISQINRIASQYPVITSRFFGSLGMQDVEIISTQGGTELYPYLEYDGSIDAIVDLTSTGETLAAHDMVPWSPAIGSVYPVLIQSIQP
jgi:ATP phosphoribosyltransferase